VVHENRECRVWKGDIRDRVHGYVSASDIYDCNLLRVQVMDRGENAASKQEVHK
jgi:hypothetical protein